MNLSNLYRKIVLITGDIALICSATYFSPWIRTGREIEIFIKHTGGSTFTLILYLLALYILDLYNQNRINITRDTFLRILIAVIIAGFISSFIFYFLPKWKYGRGIFLIQMMLVIIFITCWRKVYEIVYKNQVYKENVLILVDNLWNRQDFEVLKSPNSPFNTIGIIEINEDQIEIKVNDNRIFGNPDRIIEIVEKYKIKTIINTKMREKHPNVTKVLLDLRLRGIRIIDIIIVYQTMTKRIPVKYISDEWLLLTGGFYLISNNYIQKIKRLIDILVASSLLILLIPFLIITAILIKIDSPGPIFFKQLRIGQENKSFIIWKFRSMFENAEKDGAVWAKENDNRITFIGRIIRFLRIDETPQLFNVFKGEMSLIGPRPERPEFVNKLEMMIPYYSVRHSIKPGITGWAQVNYRYGSSSDDALNKLEYDLYYIKNMSILLDIKILLKTIGVVLIGQGAR